MGAQPIGLDRDSWHSKKSIEPPAQGELRGVKSLAPGQDQLKLSLDGYSNVARSSLHFLSRSSHSLWIGGIIVGLTLFVALAAPILAPYAPEQVMAGPRLEAPSAQYPFGTDNLGRDMFSRVIYGARIAIIVAATGVTISMGLGVGPGLLAGYRGGWIDQALCRLMDVWLAFPGLLLALVIVSRLGPSLQNSIIALGIVGAPTFFRLTRNSTISARYEPYVLAVQSVGARERRILFRHILPNIVSPLLVILTARSGSLILASGGLAFVGLGAQPPLPEWGALLANGRAFVDTASWLVICPGLCITVVVAGLNLLGDGLRDLIDPCHRSHW